MHGSTAQVSSQVTLYGALGCAVGNLREAPFKRVRWLVHGSRSAVWGRIQGFRLPTYNATVPIPISRYCTCPSPTRSIVAATPSGGRNSCTERGRYW